MAANVSLPNALTNGTPNDASQVMADLNALVSWINTNAVHLDGTKAMTGQLSSPGTDPASANEYARKAYVDAQILAGDTSPARFGAGAARVAAQSIANTATNNISFDTELWDSSTFFAPTSTNVTIPAASGGLYLVTAYAINITNNNASTCDVSVNGTMTFAVPFTTTTSTTNLHGSGSMLLPLNAGDVLTMAVRNGGVSPNNYTGSLRVARISV